MLTHCCCTQRTDSAPSPAATAQSAVTLQPWAWGHLSAQLPPQSTSVSSPFFTLSVQADALHTSSPHTPLRQSAAVAQPWPSGHKPHEPPQSLPVSSPSFSPESHVDATHWPASSHVPPSHGVSALRTDLEQEPSTHVTCSQLEAGAGQSSVSRHSASPTAPPAGTLVSPPRVGSVSVPAPPTPASFEGPPAWPALPEAPSGAALNASPHAAGKTPHSTNSHETWIVLRLHMHRARYTLLAAGNGASDADHFCHTPRPSARNVTTSCWSRRETLSSPRPCLCGPRRPCPGPAP